MNNSLLSQNSNYSIEISKTLENLKNTKDELVVEIENTELYREKLNEKLKSLQIELEKIENSLEEKKLIYGVYDKILKDSDNAYMTIVKSTEALYQMVKSEEKKITKLK